jgi:hypothetical protein
MRTCAGCGIDFIPATKGGRARFHSEACRKAASRRKAAGRPVLVAQPRAVAAEGMGGLEAATLRDLERWGKTDTVMGWLVLLIARRLDSDRDSGSGIAALSKALLTYWTELSRAAERDGADTPLTAFQRLRLHHGTSYPANGPGLPDEEPWNPDEDPA